MIGTALSLAWSRVRAQAGFLVLLAVASVGAWLYAQYRTVVTDRDDVLHRVEVICAKGGADFAAVPATRVSAGAARGAVCAQVIAGLATFKSATVEASADTLAQAMRDHDARQTHDTQAARDAAAAARDAAKRMETADAEAERRNLVDREWFAAVNGVAGLRPRLAASR